MTERRAPYTAKPSTRAVRIILPWPSRVLSPNARLCWQEKLASKKREREAAYYLTKEQHPDPVELRGRLELCLVCRPPDKRRHDLDNILASCKNSLDGICQALGIDDSQIDTVTIERYQPQKPATVIVTISERAD